jgi:cyanophycinase
MENSPKGYLIIIGGAEDKTADCVILKQVPQMLSGNDTLTVLTTATETPKEVGENYYQVFQNLSIKNIKILTSIW